MEQINNISNTETKLKLIIIEEQKKLLHLKLIMNRNHMTLPI